MVKRKNFGEKDQEKGYKSKKRCILFEKKCENYVFFHFLSIFVKRNLFINHLKRTTMKELVEQIAAVYEAFQKDAQAQIENGNKAAGTRARKASLEIEKKMKEFRKASLEAAKK